LLALTAALAAVVSVALVAGAPAIADPFAGVWVGYEAQPPVGDGSTDYMAIGLPGTTGKRAWLYYETNASGYCGGGPLAAAGKGRSQGDLLTVTVTSTRCANGAAGAFPPPFDLEMTASQDGSIDWGGLIFERIG
jgi:hypothetical protein